MKYRPLGKRVIVEILPIEKPVVKSEGGVIIADDSHEGMGKLLKRVRGKVIRCGKAVEDVKDGDIVVMEEYAGIPVDQFNPDIVWMEEEQIVAVEEGE